MKGFLHFIREQAVVGLAVGFLLGGAVTNFVSSLVADIINPIIGSIFGINGLKSLTAHLGSATLSWGNFIASAINVIIIASIVYFGVKGLGLDKLDRQPEKSK